MTQHILIPLLALVLALPQVGESSVAQSTKPFLAPLFTDNMVLQRGKPVPVWGWAKPGEKVAVSVAGASAATVADADGKWMAKLPKLPVGGPYTLKITGSRELALQNVLVGDVWICSGQSNMEMGIANVDNAATEIANANYPQVRLFTVPNVTALTPQTSVSGSWSVCSSQTVAAGGWGGFSAVGYFFGRMLNQELNVPIGLIHSSWGGTIAEAWVSGEALKKDMPDFRAAVGQVEQQAKSPAGVPYAQQLADWYAKNDAGTAAGWEKPDANDSAWAGMLLPTLWEKAGMPTFDGIVWFRKSIDLTESQLGAATLELGAIDDVDVTWVNGVRIGTTAGHASPRSYSIPAGVLRAGRNVIAVQVLDTGGGGGIWGEPGQMKLTAGGKEVPLSGTWQYRVGADATTAAAFPVNTLNNPNVATVLYNAKIAPLVPFAIKGAIWYQGESNVGRAEQYARLLPTLIRDWRVRFDVGEFPFYIVQLANFQAVDAEPVASGWAELREAQLLASRRAGNSGIATAIDIGDAVDIHPRNKQEVGRRLALNALAQVYGRDLEYSGPVFKRAKVEGSFIRISFDHADGLAVRGNGKLSGFAIAGEDGKYVWADAQIDGNTVLVSSPSIAKPVAARYAWGNNPVANLVNRAALPALPFRTDGPTK